MKILITLALVTTLATPAQAWNFRQTQYQDQQQSQTQAQGQSQANDQTIAPSQEVRQDTRFDRYAPTVVAPSLSAAGTGVCLGSVSIGLAGPMAGLSFGITKVDQGCEARSMAALLYQMGHHGAALRVLAGESVQDAMAHEGILRPGRKASGTPPAGAIRPTALAAEEAWQR